MRHNRLGCDLSPNEANTEQSDIERAVVITKATILCGPIGRLSELSSSDIRAIVCARFGLNLRAKSHDWIHGAFDTLVEQRAPLPRHDIIAR
jgi:hypothetical protein